MKTTKEKAIALRDQGMTYQQIADIVGVSKQRVAQICGKTAEWQFRAITKNGCIYPYWRAWMNANRVSRNELVRRMGFSSAVKLSHWMRGDSFPTKQQIDSILRVTGLTYEQLFYRGGE